MCKGNIKSDNVVTANENDGWHRGNAAIKKQQRKQKTKMQKHKQKIENGSSRSKKWKYWSASRRSRRNVHRNHGGWRRGDDRRSRWKNLLDIQDFIQWTKRQITSSYTPNIVEHDRNDYTGARTKTMHNTTDANGEQTEIVIENENAEAEAEGIEGTSTEIMLDDGVEKKWKLIHRNHVGCRRDNCQGCQVKNIPIETQWKQIVSRAMVTTIGSHTWSLRQVLSCYMSATAWTKLKKTMKTVKKAWQQQQKKTVEISRKNAEIRRLIELRRSTPKEEKQRVK